MTAIPKLDDEECYLAALLDDPSGIEIAEFLFVDEEQPDRCFRVWDFQYPLYTRSDTFQIDLLARALGKTNGILMRAVAFPFNYPGAEMLITAPELNHLRPITDKIEQILLGTKLGRAMLPNVKGGGINRQPQFQARFINGSRIVSRLPNRDGRGVKGCVSEGSLILTERGNIAVEEVNPGDRVLTHEGRWRRVVNTYRYADADGVVVAGGGHRGLVLSESHSMLARPNSNPNGARNLREAQWVMPAHEPDATRWYLASPVTFPQAEVPWARFTADLAWVVGRYVADGFLSSAVKGQVRTSGRLHLIIANEDRDAVVGRLFTAGMRPTARLRANATFDVEASDTDLCRFVLAHFGEHADAKTIPAWLLGAPEPIRRAFLDGYLSGDGYFDAARGRWTMGTASKALAVGLRLLGQSLGFSCGFSWSDPKVTFICGRQLVAPPKRSWRVTMTSRDRGIALVQDGLSWQKIRKVTPVRVPAVYDLAVEEDHSYIVDGLVSHNQHPLVIEMDECFPAETLILTRRGHVPIEDVVVGDEVFTHRNRWRPVTAVMQRHRELVELVFAGGSLRCSANHKFPARQVRTGKQGRDGHQRKILGEVQTVPAQDLRGRSGVDAWFLGTPTQFPPQAMPEPPAGVVANRDFWWLLGLYLAEGNCSRYNLCWSVATGEVGEVTRALDSVGATYRINDTVGEAKRVYLVAMAPYRDWLVAHAGRLSNTTMQVPVWCYGAPQPVRAAVLAGYVYGDGNIVTDQSYSPGRWQATSANYALALGVKLLAQTLGFSVTIYKTDLTGRPDSVINVGLPNERHIKRGVQYQIRAAVTSHTQVIDGQRWGQVKKVVPLGRTEVLYDLTVAEDHSFVAESTTCFNSQDYPQPGWVELIETMKAGSEGAQWRCLAEGQLVLTRRGLVAIESVKVGDEVWTHRGRWRAVLNVFDNGLRECVRVAGRGHFGIEMTLDHRVWLGTLSRQKRGSKALVAQEFAPIGNATWDRRRQSAWASPAAQQMLTSVPESVRLDTASPEWLWLYGLYLAEGYGSDYDAGGQRHRRLSWCVNDGECDEVQRRLGDLGLTSHLYRQGRSVKVTITDAGLHDWMVEAAGRLAHGKRLAPWVLGLDEAARRAVFDGMVAGDGYSGRRGRHEYATVSHELALGFKLLAQSLGMICSWSLKPARDRLMGERVIRGGPCYLVTAQPALTQQRSQSVLVDGHVWSPVNPVRDISPVGTRRVFDLEVEEDHSYVVEGVVVSNCHGVSRGVRDTYYRLTMGEDPSLPFYVHRYIASHRPSWSDEEREAKIAIYGGTEDNVDYRRNIFGEHGDASSRIFVLARLMATVRINESAWASEYNADVYTKISVNDELLRKSGLSISTFLQPPANHLDAKYSSYWAGCDIGFTNDPTEILVFGVVARPGKADLLRLLTRVQLVRISASDQAMMIAAVFAFYGARLRRMGFDKTGNGLPLWQYLRDNLAIAARVAGYGFSEKKAVAFDDRELVGRERPEDAVIEKNVIEWATDQLRKLVDDQAIELPYDVDLLTEFQGQSVVTVKEPGGTRKSYSRGSFHTLDAARTMIAAKDLEAIEAILEKPKHRGPVLDQFG